MTPKEIWHKASINEDRSCQEFCLHKSPLSSNGVCLDRETKEGTARKALLYGPPITLRFYLRNQQVIAVVTSTAFFGTHICLATPFQRSGWSVVL